jgi:TonB-linked SusC/RagA family outer membrane protein
MTRRVCWNLFVLLALAPLAAAQELADSAASRGPRFLLSAALRPVPVDISRTPVLRQRLSLDLGDVPLKVALSAIAQQSGLDLVYSDDVLPAGARVSLRAEGITVAAALTDVLADADVDVVFSRNGRAALVPRAAMARLDSVTIHGRVTDAKTGQPVSNATVLVEQTRFSARTDEDGRYSIVGVPAGTYIVTAHRLGYQRAAQSVTTSSSEVVVDFALAILPTTLDEIVVTVTGEQRRVELGNAIGTISADSLARTAPVTSLADLINARVPGAQVLLGDGFSGASPRLRLRGINSFSVSDDPLVIVDGARVESSPYTRGGAGALPGRLSDLSPDEIESIEVVKGPSAATLYGTDAANGVLVIKTKRGAGGPPQWNTYAEVGAVTIPGRYRTNWYAWGHAPDGTVMQCTLLLLAAGACVQDSITTLNLFTDPSRTPLHAGLRQDYGAQVSGGTAAVRYFLSSQLQSEDGGLRLQGAEFSRLDSISGGNVRDYQVRPNAYRRINLRGNLSAAVSPRVELTLSTGFVDGLTRLQNGSVFTYQVFSPGYVDANGGWAFSRPSDIFAPRAEEHLSRFTSSLGATWQMAAWLQSRATAGVDFSSAFEDGLQIPGEGPSFYATGSRVDGRISSSLTSLDFGITATNRVTDALSLQTAAGAQYNRRSAINLSASAVGLAPGSETLTGAVTTTTTESTDESVVAGTYVQETAAFSNRLFLTAAVRADGAGSFGSAFKVAWYPKASASWLISDEPFFPHDIGISSLRLRAAYGASGVQPSSVAALETLQPVTGFVDGTAQSGLRQATLGNRDLRPERQREFEGGMDLEFFTGRVRFEGTYYLRRSTDALVNGALGPSAGVTSQFINIGSVQNRGWEGAVDVRLIESPTVTVAVSANGSINSNTLLSLAPGVSVNAQPQLWSQVPGYPLYGWWDRPILGFNDANHDGIIEPGEVQIAATPQFMGPTTPTRQLTLGGTVTLLGRVLSISTLLDHRGGYVEPVYSLIYGCLFANNCQAVNDPKTPLEDQARAVAAIGFNTGPYTVSGAFWRWRELSMTANLPARTARLVGARNVSVTVSGRNLALWTRFPGVDPEGTINPGTNLSGESLSAPASRYWLLRVNLGY